MLFFTVTFFGSKLMKIFKWGTRFLQSVQRVSQLFFDSHQCWKMITTEVKVFLFLFKFIPILLDMALNAFLKSLILGSELLVLLEGSPMPGTYSFKLLPKGLVARLQRSEILRFIHHKLYRLIMLKLPSATFTLLFLRTLSPFSRRRKDSHWIYSSQSE